MIRLADLFPNTPADALPLRHFDWARSGVALPYVIFITGRCGSTLLTHLLAETGLCGNPDEFFNEERIAALSGQWQIEDFSTYFTAVVRRTMSHRRFGFEIDPFRFEQLRKMVSFPDIFMPRRTVFFWMTRRDIVGQAWSYAKAKKSGLWHRFADGSEERRGEPRDEAISDTDWWREILLILMSERIMEDYFATLGVTPFRLDYEMLVTDRRRTVVSVLQALSCGPEAIARRLGPQDDHTTRNRYDDWYDAMIAFCGRYRDELRHIDRHRAAVDTDALRFELNTRHALGA
jgi:LPS sulfotransferase NodH